MIPYCIPRRWISVCVTDRSQIRRIWGLRKDFKSTFSCNSSYEFITKCNGRHSFLTEILENRSDFKFLHFANMSHHLPENINKLCSKHENWQCNIMSGSCTLTGPIEKTMERERMDQKLRFGCKARTKIYYNRFGQ